MSNKVYITLEVDDKGSATMKKFGGNADQAFDKLKKHARAGGAQAGKMERAWGNAIKNIQHHWKMYSAVAGVAMAATAAAVVAGSKKALAAASDLQEVQGKFDVVFAGREKLAEAWSKTLVDSYAMSTRESKQYLSSVQDLLVPMGMAADKAGLMSNEVVKLSADLGSFNNLPTGKVMEDIQSALVGNYETMKKYGVVLNATVVQEKALAMGLADTKDELTAGMKAQASYQLMVEGSTAAIGDMARTQESAANQEKQTKALLEDITALFGKTLIPYYQAALKEVNKWLKVNKDIIAQNLPKYIEKVGAAIVFTIKVMRFFHQGWQGIKLVGTAAVHAIAVGLDELLGGIRFLFTPLDMIFEGLKKLGVIKVNPFDKIEKSLGQFRASSMDVTKQVMADIKKTNKTYDLVINKVEGWQKQIKAIPVEQSKTEKKIKKSLKKIGKVQAAQTKEEIKAAIKMEKEQRKMAKETAAYQKKLIRDKARAIKDYAKESTKIYDRMYDDVQKLNLGDYAYNLKLLAQRYTNYKDHLKSLAKQDSKYADGVQLLDKWLVAEKEKLHDDWARKHGTVLDRMEVRWKDYQKEGIDANRVMYDAISAGAAEMESQLSDAFFNVLTGQMDKVKFDWDAMWKSMVRSTADHMAKIVTETALNTAAKAASAGMDWLGTSMGWWAAGSWEIKKQHMAMLHPGEMVIPADMAEKVRVSASNNGNIGLGEPMTPEAVSTIPGSFKDVYTENAMKAAMFSAVKGFGVRTAINILTGLGVQVNPLGVIGTFLSAGLKGYMATRDAKKLYGMIYGKDAPYNPDQNVNAAMQSLDWSGFDAHMASMYGMMAINNPGYSSQDSGDGYGGWGGFGDTEGIGGVGSGIGSFGIARRGGLFSTPTIMAEHGDEWAVPTYEPERSRFLKDVGADPDKLASSISKKLGSRSGGGITINGPLVSVEGTLIADEDTFNEFVEKIDERLYKLQQWGH